MIDSSVFQQLLASWEEYKKTKEYKQMAMANIIDQDTAWTIFISGYSFGQANDCKTYNDARQGAFKPTSPAEH